jgi:hypothetical protein
MTPNHAVLPHHGRTAIESFGVPVERFSAPLVHRVEADITRRRHVEEQAIHHPLPLGFHFCIECVIEFVGARLVRRPNLRVNFCRHLVHPKFDDRHVRGRRFKQVMQRGA